MVQVRSIMSRPRLPTLRHVVEHDRVAALGHDRQLGAGLVGPHAEPEEAEAEPVADRLALLEMARRPRRRSGEGSRAARPDSSNWPAGSRLIVPSAPVKRDDVAVLDRPAPSRIRSGPSAGRGCRRARPSDGARWSSQPIDELLVLGADAPVLARLLAAGEDRQQIVAAFDRRAVALSSVRCRHSRRRLAAPQCAPALPLYAP